MTDKTGNDDQDTAPSGDGAELRRLLGDEYDELLFADGFDDAIMGTVERCGSPPVVCCDSERCIDILVQRDGLSYEDAVEHFGFNVLGSYVVPLTPMFLHRHSSGS